ncbi:MAG TPA: molecular chaperone GroEL, partial [Acholeplasmatales bacterium]|nr:molecular chaperone GroEL [Acholeplasmatales bacterium]
KQSKPNFGFDAKLGVWVDMFKAGIVDPTKVARTALLNAASISALFITTEVAVVDIKEEKEPPVPQGMY